MPLLLLLILLFHFFFLLCYEGFLCLGGGVQRIVLHEATRYEHGSLED